jgi:hypothetical protein
MRLTLVREAPNLVATLALAEEDPPVCFHHSDHVSVLLRPTHEDTLDPIESSIKPI